MLIRDDRVRHDRNVLRGDELTCPYAIDLQNSFEEFKIY